jgi:hypothetical protein
MLFLFNHVSCSCRFNDLVCSQMTGSMILLCEKIKKIFQAMKDRKRQLPKPPRIPGRI